jgi:hypothetical protein
MTLYPAKADPVGDMVCAEVDGNVIEAWSPG